MSLASSEGKLYDDTGTTEHKERRHMPFDQRLINWQRKLDPSNFSKAKGAVYHTAPAVLPPDSPDYPDGMPDNAVAIMFQLDATCWILGEPEKEEVNDPTFQEGKPRSRSAKNGPIFLMSDDRVICVIPFKDNYYWSAKVLSQHKVLHVSIKPGKKRMDDKPRKVQIVAAFLPNENEE